MEVFRDRWQLELKIVRHIIPDLGVFEEALVEPFLILSNWYRLWCCRWASRSSRRIVVAIMDEGRQMSVIGLGLRVVNLRYGSRQRRMGAKLSEAELWGVLCGSWFAVGAARRFVALQVVGPHRQCHRYPGRLDFAVALRMHVLVPSPSLPRRRLVLQGRISRGR